MNKYVSTGLCISKLFSRVEVYWPNAPSLPQPSCHIISPSSILNPLIKMNAAAAIIPVNIIITGVELSFFLFLFLVKVTRTNTTIIAALTKPIIHWVFTRKNETGNIAIEYNTENLDFSEYKAPYTDMARPIESRVARKTGLPAVPLGRTGFFRR